MNNLDVLESLSQSVGLRDYGQHDPLVEYRKEAHHLFKNFWVSYNAMVFGNIFKLAATSQNQSRMPSTTSAPKDPKFANVGRNDPCPCGSGKKYKKCHGK